MRLRRALLPLLAIIALVPAACGDDDTTTTTESAATAEATAEATATETAAATEDSAAGEAVTITMKGFAFDPAEQTVKVGQEVTWKNEDTAPHNAVSDDGVLKTNDVNQGETTEPFTPEAAGTIEYICTIHPQMKATLTVTE